MGRRIIDDNKLLAMMEEGRTQKEASEFFGVSEAAVSKRLKRLTPLPDSFENLSEKEKKFALEIAGGKTQTQAALNSFEVTSMDSAKSLGSELMRKPSIQQAVSDLLEDYGMGRIFRIKKLRTHADNRDPNVSLKSIDIANKMDGIYSEDRPEQTTNVKQEMAILLTDNEKLRNLREKLELELAWLNGDITDAEFKDLGRADDTTG